MDARDIRHALFQAIEASADGELVVVVELPDPLMLADIETAILCFQKAGWLVDHYPNTRARLTVVRLDARERLLEARARTDDAEPG